MVVPYFHYHPQLLFVSILQKTVAYNYPTMQTLQLLNHLEYLASHQEACPLTDQGRTNLKSLYSQQYHKILYLEC